MNPLIAAGLLLGGLAYLRQKRKPARRILRNVDGFLDGSGFHPIRGSEGYDPDRAGDGTRRAPAELKSFVRDMDREIDRTRRQLRKSGASKREMSATIGQLKQERLDGILGSLSSKTITKFEDAQQKIDELEGLKWSQESSLSDPAYQFRDLARIARRFPDGDVTKPAFRQAVKKRFGMSIDEIASSMYPGEPNGEELAIRDAERAQRLARESNTKAIDNELRDLKGFVRKIETGQIFRLHVPKFRPPARRKGKETKEVSSLAEARRFGKGVRAGSRTAQLIQEAEASGDLSQSRETGLWRMGPYTARTPRELFETPEGKKRKTLAEQRQAYDKDVASLNRTRARAGMEPVQAIKGRPRP